MPGLLDIDDHLVRNRVTRRTSPEGPDSRPGTRGAKRQRRPFMDKSDSSDEESLASVLPDGLGQVEEQPWRESNCEYIPTKVRSLRAVAD
jgi:hypothetical protein